MIKPKALQKGDTIGICGTSGPTDKENIERGIKTLENFGYKVKLSSSCYDKYGYLAGDDRTRANGFNEMFKDKGVDAIMCLRGGYGAPRILDMLDYEIVKKNPKIFIGYSDITGIHVVLNKVCELVTFHGPMATTEVSKGMDDFTTDSLLKSLTCDDPIGLISNPDGYEIKTLVGGEAEGEIVGGNLSLIAGCIGTPYEIDTKGKLLVLEDVDEEPYRIDRMLTQLALSGKLKDANGIILGDFNNCDRDDEDSLSLLQVIKDIIIPFNKPTIYNLQVGHCKSKITLPLGVKAKLNSSAKKLVIVESALQR